MSVVHKCKACGSTDVRRDAFAEWSVALQMWVMAALYDQATCMQCQCETTLETVETPEHERIER